jgi:pimeloyl-ACP methyl ester carboxylesterase
MWDPQMPTLLRYFPVLRLDLRGHGASEVPAGDYTIDQLGRDVLATVDATGHFRFAYCGLSIGGMIGQWLGSHAGELTRIHE